MELSPEGNSLDLKLTESRTSSVSSKTGSLDCDIRKELIDMTKIQFDDDEYWLYKLSNCGSQVENLQMWLYSNTYSSHEELLLSNTKHTGSDNQKIFDSRTFTRPKKRFTRLSIEKYNEAVYGIDNKNDNELNSSRESMNDCGLLSTDVLKTVNETTQPLSFDLTQPSNSYYFDNVLANIRETDSFQNMSPPSLVNSICSTTFANLMENSFIKNDPILREIRDTDFTESILLQDSEAPMFQSITESCSSLNSDTPESFLKKVSRSDTFKKKSSIDLGKTIIIDDFSNSHQLNTTFGMNANPDSEAFNETKINNSALEETVVPSKHETFRRTPKKNTSVSSISDVVNCTFKSLENLIESKPQFIRNSLIRENTIEDLKKQLSEPTVITDKNRLSYYLDDENLRTNSECNETQQHLNTTVDIKRSSISTGSTDSLDRMSNMSNSSRGSSRMLSMAEVDAIVEMQEKSLQQVMSTPKVNTAPRKFWANNLISPIISKENLSDSDISSNEEYKSVRSSMSKGSLENYSTKSVEMDYLGDLDTKIKSMQQPQYVSTQKSYKTNLSSNRISNSNIKHLQLKNYGSLNNVSKPSNVEVAIPATNLKLMNQKLKASYTSLKPMSTNLPIAPPITSTMNVTRTLTKTKKSNGSQNFESHTKIVEVHPMPREKIPATDVFVKPVHSRTSCLPRPTGIPRPSTRIPAPQGNIRPASSRTSTHKFNTRDGYQ